MAGDVRYLPFGEACFDVVLSADNSFAHLHSDHDLLAAMTGMRRVLRDQGLMIVTLREYEDARASRRQVTTPQVVSTPDGQVVTFQLWHWHEDGERYDFDHVQLLPEGDTWQVRTRRATSRALTRDHLATLAAEAGFADVRWHAPEDSGFFQPVLTARPDRV